MNTVGFQTNSVDYLKNAGLGCGGVEEFIPTPKFVHIFLENGTFYSDMWTKFSWEYLQEKESWLCFGHVAFHWRYSGVLPGELSENSDSNFFCWIITSQTRE